VRGAERMGRREPVDAEHARAALRQLIRARAAHRAQPEDDRVERLH
jgi:hypothetical protein